MTSTQAHQRYLRLAEAAVFHSTDALSDAEWMRRYRQPAMDAGREWRRITAEEIRAQRRARRAPAPVA